MRKEARFLYHYTTIESLALILKNRTIRFCPLDKMDDLQEKEAGDLKDAGQFIYVSSWTDEEEESIPMWNMYASLESGVRIRLPFEPFATYDITRGDVCDILGKPRGDEADLDEVFGMSIIPIDEIKAGRFFSPDLASEGEIDDRPIQVEYTPEKEKLFPKVLVYRNGKPIGMNMAEIGKYKNCAWGFQKEWRHRFSIFPGSAEAVLKNGPFDEIWDEICSGKKGRPLEYYERKIKESAFREMRITKSPNLSAGNEVILRSLIEKYNPGVVIEDSELREAIR